MKDLINVLWSKIKTHVIYILIICLLMLCLSISVNKCSNTSREYKHNIEALNDTIKYYQDKNGNLFSMNMSIDEVIEILGTPKSSENLWAKYPNASVGFYKIKYDGIGFYYYDNSNKISRIDVYSSEYSILDNNITTGDSEKNIKNLYRTPWIEQRFLDPTSKRYEKEICYSTIHTNLYFKEQTCDYYYCIGFYIDEETSKCNSFYILWNTDY